MKIDKINKLTGDLIEVVFDDGTHSQMKLSELMSESASPIDFKSEVRAIIAKDIGKGGEKSGKSS